MRTCSLLLFIIFVFAAGCGTIISQIDGHKKVTEETNYRHALEKHRGCKDVCDTSVTQKYQAQIDDYEKIIAPKYKSGCTMSVPNVYSGVSTDLTLLLAPWICRDRGSRDIATIALYPLYAPLSLIDMVLCAGTDTLILPYTIYRQINYGNIMERSK
jgi:uncharacterized protein YceK